MKSHVRSGAAELCVEDTGTPGMPVVCLHAAVCDRRMWAAQREALGGAHRVIAYDRRGHGESRWAAERHSEVDDLIEVLDAAQVNRAVLIGCSRGGRLAIDTALAHPDRVRALVLVACGVSGAPADGDGPHAPVVQAKVEALAAARARGDLATVNELQAQVWLDGPAQPAGRVGGVERELFLSMNALALAAPPIGEPIEPPPAWDRLGDIEVPALIVRGGFDFPHFETRLSEVERRIRGAESFVMPSAAHLPGLEQPVPFNARVMRFLERFQRRNR
jgi:pimeloyl-ACP methyl ester carboxylesterase